MPASMLLRASGLLTAIAIASAALFFSRAAPPDDPYSATIKLSAGALTVIGSLYMAYAVDCTFLRNGGRGAFKALYWACFAAAGAGVIEASSAFIPANVPLAAALATLSFAGTGLMLLSYARGI